MKEKLCPFCNKPIRSDASAKYHCQLCGMAITSTTPQEMHDTSADERHYFCCETCRDIYTTRLP